MHRDNLRTECCQASPRESHRVIGLSLSSSLRNPHPKSQDDLGVWPGPLPRPPLLSRETPELSRVLTRPENTERGRRPGPRPAGTSSSFPPSFPCQKAAHPPGSRHCRGQDGGAGAGERGWNRESEGLRRWRSSSWAARALATLSQWPTGAPTGALHRKTPGSAAAAAAAGSSAPASSSRRRHCRPISPQPSPALAPCCRRPTAAAYSPLNSQSPAGPRHLTHRWAGRRRVTHVQRRSHTHQAPRGPRPLRRLKRISPLWEDTKRDSRGCRRPAHLKSRPIQEVREESPDPQPSSYRVPPPRPGRVESAQGPLGVVVFLQESAFPFPCPS